MYCFTKKRRLLTTSDYDYVFANADKILTAHFIILYRQNELGHARLGFALSKKKIAKAHQRNRLKRLVREGFRTQQLPAIDLIFLARQGSGKVENQLITAHLGNAWKKLKRLSVN